VRSEHSYRTGFATGTVSRLIVPRLLAAALLPLTLEAAALQYGGSFSLENIPGGNYRSTMISRMHTATTT